LTVLGGERDKARRGGSGEKNRTRKGEKFSSHLSMNFQTHIGGGKELKREKRKKDKHGGILN